MDAAFRKNNSTSNKRSMPTNIGRAMPIGHGIHICKDIILYAIANNIDMLVLPPHTTHKMQPLDVGFMGPLKSYMNDVLKDHIKNAGSVGLLNTRYTYINIYI